jgi:hypothetical protein
VGAEGTFVGSSRDVAFAIELPSARLLTPIKGETRQIFYQTMQIFAVASRDVMMVLDFRLQDSPYQAN